MGGISSFAAFSEGKGFVTEPFFASSSRTQYSGYLSSPLLLK